MATDACFHGNVLEELLDLLKLEKIEANIFRGRSQDLGFGAVFGGGRTAFTPIFFGPAMPPVPSSTKWTVSATARASPPAG